MNKENTKKLFNNFPALYRGRSERGCMHDFSCGDGWFDLVYKLSEDIEKEAYRVGSKPTDTIWPRALQVKEKWGTLSFYLRTKGDEKDEDSDEMEVNMQGCMISISPVASNEKIRELVTEASRKSAYTCEDCGEPGEMKRVGWMRVTCAACEAKREEENANR